MNLAKFAVRAIKEWNPLGPEAILRRERNKAFRKAHRKAKRGETLSEDEYELLQTTKEAPVAIDLGTRTSTNTVVGTPILAGIYVNLVEMLPYPQLVAALTTPEAVVVAASVFAWIVARFSKTPTNPGKL